MRMLVGEVQLRNHYRIYDEGFQYLVEGENDHGQTHGQYVSVGVVEYLHRALAGQLVRVEDAEGVLGPVARQLVLPYTYGHKLHFYAQDVLIVLVALNRARVSKEGRRYLYRLSVL